MVRRSLGVALWGVVGLLAGVLGALSALIGTGAGRNLVARAAEGALRQVFTGTIEIGDVGGTLLTGLTLSDVRLYDPDTTLVAWLPRAELSYNPLEFAPGRVVLFELALREPLFNIVQHPSGRLNAEELLRLGGPDTAQGPRGPATLILFRNVRIEDGTVMLRLRAGPAPDPTHEIDAAARDGPLRVRRFDHLTARLAALRLSSPRERGIRMDITVLAVPSSDPGVELRDVAGRITIVGDSLDADLERVRLPGSALQARGRVRWPRGTLLFDLAARADSATLSDFRFVDSRFPDGAVLHGGVALRSHGGRLLEIRLEPLTLSSGGGTVTGRLTALSAADSGLVALRAADLEARDFDLEFARPFLDRLPLAGRLSGRTLAEGAIGALHLETDWVFRDALVPGWPQSTVRGRGEVDLSRGAGVGFRSFAVDAATIDLRTVRRLVPAVRLQGGLDAAGTLTGRLADAQFSGTLRHRPRDLPPSVIRGVVRLDSRSDTLAVFADVVADSLSFDGLRGSFPGGGLPLAGAVTGPVRLDGTLAALATHADLQSTQDGGGVQVDGVLTLLASRLGARDATVRTRELDLSRWLAAPAAPSSRLSGTLAGTVGADRPGERSAEPRRWSGGRREPAREIELPGADGGVPGAKPRRQQRQHTVHLDAAAVLRGLQVGVRRQRRQRAVEPHRARHRAREREPPSREAPAQAVERERVRDHVGEHAERVAAAVEPHHAADHAGGQITQPVPQRAAELRVGEPARERAGGVERALQPDGRYEPPHRPQVDRRRVHREGAEAHSGAARKVHLAATAHGGLRPARDEGVAEHPVRLQVQRADRSLGQGAAAQAARQGQPVEEGAGELEIEVARLEAGRLQGHEPGIGRAERREPARDGAAARGEGERLEPDLQQAAAVGAQRDAPVQHRPVGEAGVDEPEVREGGGVGARREIEQQRAARPADAAAGLERGAWEPHPLQVGVERVPHDGDAAGHVAQLDRGVAALHCEPGNVHPDPPLAWRREPQGREPGGEMVEAEDPERAVPRRGVDLMGRVGRRAGAQAQHHRTILDAHVAEQDQRRRAARPLRRVGAAQAEQLLGVEPPARVLHDVEEGLAQGELEQHDAARRELERVVGELGAGEPGDERGVGVVQADVGEGQSGEQRATDVADLDRPGEHLPQRALGRPRHQVPSGARADQGGERPEEAGEQPDHPPQRDPERSPHHVRRPVPPRTATRCGARTPEAGPAGTRRPG